MTHPCKSMWFKIRKVKLDFDVIAQGRMRGMALRKACLPKSADTKPKVGDSCWIAGWTRSAKKKLKSVDVNILDKDKDDIKLGCPEYKGRRFQMIIFIHVIYTV